jgi:hypothetical protein
MFNPIRLNLIMGFTILIIPRVSIVDLEHILVVIHFKFKRIVVIRQRIIVVIQRIIVVIAQLE